MHRQFLITCNTYTLVLGFLCFVDNRMCQLESCWRVQLMNNRADIRGSCAKLGIAGEKSWITGWGYLTGNDSTGRHSWGEELDKQDGDI